MKEDDEEEEGMGRRRRGGEVINQFTIFINPEKEEEEQEKTHCLRLSLCVFLAIFVSLYFYVRSSSLLLKLIEEYTIQVPNIFFFFFACLCFCPTVIIPI